MKRIASLTLAAALAVGMGASAFATAPHYDPKNIKGFADAYDLADGVTSLPTGATWNDPGNQVLNIGDRYANDKFTMDVNLRAYMFGASVEAGETLYEAVNVEKLVADRKVQLYGGEKASDITSWDMLDERLVDSATPTSLKREVIENQQDATGTPFATDAARATAIYNRYRGYHTTSTSNQLAFHKEVKGVADNFAPVAGTEITSGVTDKNRNLTSTEIRDNSITVGVQIRENSDAVKSVELDRNNGKVEFKLTERWVSTEKKDFMAVLYLNFNGRRADDKHLTILGRIMNPELYVYKDANTVDIHDGVVAIGAEFNNKIAVDVGNGATIHTKLFKDKKYYGTTSRDVDEADDVVFRQHPDVDNVLTFHVVGLNNTGDYVTLSTDYDGYYVYDKDMNYLGRGNEQLKFSSKYYLANKRLDVETEDDEVEEDEAPVPSNPTTGGDGQSNNNVNANPGTGR